MNVYLLVFDASQSDRKTVQRAIDKTVIVENWFAFFDNAMCLASHATADILSRFIRETFPDLVFIITTVDPLMASGWMPKAIWTFLSEPRPASVEAA